MHDCDLDIHILRLYFCNYTIKVGDINCLNSLVPGLSFLISPAVLFPPL